MRKESAFKERPRKRKGSATGKRRDNRVVNASGKCIVCRAEEASLKCDVCGKGICPGCSSDIISGSEGEEYIVVCEECLTSDSFLE